MENAPIPLFRKFLLELVVFICGAVVMIFELVGSRVVAPYLGTSIYVWTSLIGVVLASLSVGYYVGGYLADKKPSVKSVALIIILSAVAIAFSAFTSDIVCGIISMMKLNFEIKAILTSLVLFAPASFLLGMVSPYAVKLKMNDLAKSGRTAGNLYAISTAGSIFGTFLAGFYIIPNFGSTNSLVILSLVLTFVAVLLLLGSKMGKNIKASIFTIMIFLGSTQLVSSAKKQIVVADVDTEYSRILVLNAKDEETGKPILTLTNGISGIQAAIFTDGTKDLVFKYTQFYDLFQHFVPNPSNVLMIGGSAYTYPKYFIENHPNSKMDVIEIDPGMTNIARQYFGLKDEKNLTIYHQDARIFLNENKNKYDVIFGDAFGSGSSIPFQLTTKETAIKKYDALNDDGIVMINIISSVGGDKGRFARAEYTTYKEVFPQVFLFATQNTDDENMIQNLILLALKSPENPKLESSDKKMSELLSKLWKHPIANDVPILTDDFAPVEYYEHLSV